MNDRDPDLFWAIFALGMICGASILGAIMAAGLIIHHQPVRF